jgi:hypothetical protein
MSVGRRQSSEFPATAAGQGHDLALTFRQTPIRNQTASAKKPGIQGRWRVDNELQI